MHTRLLQNVSMAAKEQDHISNASSNDKRSITLTVCESLGWQNPTVPTDLQKKDTKMAPNR